MPSPQETTITERELKANRAAERDLIELILTGESVALVGSGYSIACGFPDWERLIDKLAEGVDGLEPGEGTGGDARALMDRAEKVYEAIVAADGKQEFYTRLGKIFKAAETAVAAGHTSVGDAEDEGLGLAVQPSLSRFHLDLVRLPFRGFLTTNYDRLLEQALVESEVCTEPPRAVPVWEGDAPLVSRATRALAVPNRVEHVIHLHGDYRQGCTVVLTKSSYEEAYGIDRERKTWLYHLIAAVLMTRRLVFVGFGLRDHFFEQMLTLVADLQWAWGDPVHFAVLDYRPDEWPEAKQRAARLRNQLGVQVVFYELDDDPEATSGGHSELHALFDRIVAAYKNSLMSGDEPMPAQRGTPGALLPWVRTANENAAQEVIPNED